jgi:hypothetical protein
MSQFKLLAITTPWECECCGSGEHLSIALYEHVFEDYYIVWRGSYNDQFGGTLQEGDELIHTVYGDSSDYINGMAMGLIALGHTVEIYLNGKKVDDRSKFI